jgi:hypothetical protein
MATPNFRHMKDFPLFVWHDKDYDEYLARHIIVDIKYFNQQYKFYKIHFINGYYEGAQFFVELDYEPDNVNELTLEKNIVRKDLEWLSDKYNMKAIRVVGIFSNGEAIYENI